MQNTNTFQLYFTNVQILNSYTERNYTFVSSKPVFENLIKQSFSDNDVRNMTIRINQSVLHLLDSVKEPVFLICVRIYLKKYHMLNILASCH